mmetsp:Transcript_100550/g.300026  ORF Transcript_100550/g.300026 Transcript_100550/m.300026 type:complete len:229 (+) Transcript_100550:270-956(+)
MGVDCTPSFASVRPVKWVTNWLPAAHSSCSSHVMSIMRQPCSVHHFRWSSQRRASRIRTRSKTNGRPLHPCFPLSGPNIGCVHRMSQDSGSSASMVVLAWTFTDSTSMISILLAEGSLALAIAATSFRTMDSKLKMLTEMMRTSSRCSTNSSNVSHQTAPMLAAASELSDLEVAKTSYSLASFFPMNWPKLPKPMMPSLRLWQLLTLGLGFWACGFRMSNPVNEPPRA